jgi:hypothetical protein
MSKSLRDKIMGTAVMLIFFGLIAAACGVTQLNKSSEPTCNGHTMSPGNVCHMTERRGFDTTSSDMTYSEMKKNTATGGGPFFIIAGSTVMVAGVVTLVVLVRRGKRTT